MIGNRVKVILVDDKPPSITGTLKRLDHAGATVWRENSVKDQEANVFIPMHRIVEVIDLGRMPS